MSATGSRGGGDARAAGFTLLEMLVVLAIAALVAGIGFPRLQAQIGAQEWRTGVAAVTSLLRQARARAVWTSVPATVTIAAPGNRLGIVAATTVTLPQSVRVAAAAPVTFFDDGSASGGTLTVTAGSRRATLSVAPATGLVTVRPA